MGDEHEAVGLAPDVGEGLEQRGVKSMGAHHVERRNRAERPDAGIQRRAQPADDLVEGIPAEGSGREADGAVCADGPHERLRLVDVDRNQRLARAQPAARLLQRHRRRVDQLGVRGKVALDLLPDGVTRPPQWLDLGAEIVHDPGALAVR